MESILGPGFWYLGEWVHSPVDNRVEEADRFDNIRDAADPVAGLAEWCHAVFNAKEFIYLD